MENQKDNLPGTFLEIARQHAAKLNGVTIRRWCGVCCAEKIMPLLDESGNTERYQCPDCQMIYSYVVR